MYNVKCTNYNGSNILYYMYCVYELRYIDSSWVKTINQTLIELYGKFIYCPRRKKKTELSTIRKLFHLFSLSLSLRFEQRF